jgi:tripartite-type tricarboxylate transporter receptor subunit TctC
MRVRASLMVAAMLLADGPAVAQPPSARPLHLIVPYPPGGTVDFIARQMVAPLRSALGQDLLIENLAGAGGAIGLQKLLAEPADGQTLALATDSDAVLVPLVTPELKYRSSQFRLLGVVSKASMALVVGAGRSEADLASLLKAAGQAGARPLSVGSYGVGSNAHLCAEDFARRSGVALLHVPYKGIAPLLQDLMGSHLDMACLPVIGGIYDLLQAHKLRPLALAAARRHPGLPALPTVAEASDLRGFEHATWAGLVVPLSTPEAVVLRLHAATQAALADKGLRAALDTHGSEAGAPMSLAQARQFITAETERLTRLSGLLR